MLFVYGEPGMANAFFFFSLLCFFGIYEGLVETSGSSLFEKIVRLCHMCALVVRFSSCAYWLVFEMVHLKCKIYGRNGFVLYVPLKVGVPDESDVQVSVVLLDPMLYS